MLRLGRCQSFAGVVLGRGIVCRRRIIEKALAFNRLLGRFAAEDRFALLELRGWYRGGWNRAREPGPVSLLLVVHLLSVLSFYRLNRGRVLGPQFVEVRPGLSD